MEKIFDAHSHILFSDGVDESFVKEHLVSGVTEGIVMACPFISEITCNHDERHYTCIRNNDGEDMVYCTKCNHFIRNGNLIYRKYNLDVITSIEKINAAYHTKFYPFVTSASSNRMLQDEFEFFSSQYKNCFFGIKIYTGLSFHTLNEIHFNAPIPLLIHTGGFENQKPKNMIDFLLNYEGPILLAHFARFDKETIEILKGKPNIYFDSSPAVEMFDRFYKNKHRELNFNSPDDLYYEALNLIGAKRLLWGSDYPYSNVSRELEIINRLHLTPSEKRDILYNNAIRFLYSSE